MNQTLRIIVYYRYRINGKDSWTTDMNKLSTAKDLLKEIKFIASKVSFKQTVHKMSDEQVASAIKIPVEDLYRLYNHDESLPMIVIIRTCFWLGCRIMGGKCVLC